METIVWEDFKKIEMRVATIIDVQDFPEAKKPAYQLMLDFGPELGTRKTSAQITRRYSKEELMGQQVIAVINFPKKQIANFMSECLVLGAVQKDDVVLLKPETKIPNGLQIG
ncbi:tRNA-binding protein [Mesonia sediminis]|uniref:tRNA-binding protein n=1 Tax=Mesonia sediminis TaxID=1703946 RepID=A0ABW5SD67_9FLAO